MTRNLFRAIKPEALVKLFPLCLFALNCATAIGAPPKKSSTLSGTVTIFADKPVNEFRPDRAFGAGVDGMEKGDIAKVYTKKNIAAMLSAGFKPLAYRLRTELGVEAWHWNAKGGWSDPAKRQGYWTSDDKPGALNEISNGYALPRRGSSADQANNKGYSRLDDGDKTSFWKSNPYLDATYTHEDNRLHPQWAIIDFGERVPIDAIRILWGEPFATEYRVEFWEGEDPKEADDIPYGKWKAFPSGTEIAGKGGDELRKLTPMKIPVRLVRIFMTRASGISDKKAADSRDRLGYAIREVYCGVSTADGKLQDRMKHSPNAQKQTRIVVSSTDPWHQAKDRDENVEQPGFDRIYRSGLTNGQPMLTPVGLLYDTPENAVAEVRWLKARGFPVTQIELGEEPDGQYVAPEDYGALYIQWADALRKVDPKLKFGGPGFQTATDGWIAWPDENGEKRWMFRFLNYLQARGHLKDFNFFSFEWYPFDDVTSDPALNLQQHPAILSKLRQGLKDEGVPTEIPWIISEYGYSAFAGQPEVEMPGAILNFDIVGQFLTLGGSVAYLYGYEPNVPIQEIPDSDSWGNLMMFLSDDDRRILAPLPTFYAAKLLTLEWAQPGNGLHKVYRAECDLKSATGDPLVSAYALLRPDGITWSLALLNKDPLHAIAISVRMEGVGAKRFAPTRLVQYSSAQFAWKANGEKGKPIRNLPPIRRQLSPELNGKMSLPPYSITILR